MVIWSSEHKGFAGDPAAHIESLASVVGISSARRTGERISARNISHDLVMLGDRLAQSYPEVRTQRYTGGRHSYRSPVSWQNGAWNHAVSSSFDVADKAEVEKRIRSLIGTLRACIPDEDRSVIAFISPDEEELAKLLSRELGYVRGMFVGSRSVELPKTAEGPLDTSPLERMVLSDLRP